MTKPNDPRDADFRATLPADLQALDKELSEIRIEERPSFGPELEGELAQAWRTRARAGHRISGPWVRNLMAAGIAGLLITGVSVPSARAAVVNFVQAVAEDVLPGLFSPEAEPVAELPVVEVPEPPPPAPEPRTEMVVTPMDASDEVVTSTPDMPTIPRVEMTFPEIVSRQTAAEIIASHYPVELQRAGVEGTVKLLFWIDGQGVPENIQKSLSSGNSELDYSAMRAVRDLRFKPATRNGMGVGTWVEVSIHFFALTGAGIIGSDSMDAGM